MERENLPDESSQSGDTEENRGNTIGERLRRVSSVARERVQAAKSVVSPARESSDQKDPGEAAPSEGAHAAQTPSIADKVRFWEEQDRINKELIPRVLKSHELLTDHIAGHQQASVQIGAVEARVVERINDHIAGHQEARVQIEVVEARMVERISKVRIQAMLVASVSLVVAIVSIVVSLARQP